MASLEGLKHCPTCDASIQRTGCGIPYCPNRDCPAVKGAHDWELVPIVLTMAATDKLHQAVGLAPRPAAPPAKPARPLPTHCWKCGTALIDYHGPFGPYCPAKECDVIDGVGMTPEEFKQATDPDGAKALTRALRSHSRR